MFARTVQQDRWLALGLLLALLMLGYLVLVHPWWTVPMHEVGERIAELQQRELRIRTQLQQRPQIEQELTAAHAAFGDRPGFLAEPSAELATAALTQRLETLVAQVSPGNRSCAITNRSPFPSTANERFRRIVVQVTLRCGMSETATLLHALESGRPRLFVDNLNILAQSPNSQDANTQEQAIGLNVSFDLYGYLKPITAAPGAGGGRAR